MDCQWPSAATCMVVSSIPADLISPQQWEEINVIHYKRYGDSVFSGWVKPYFTQPRVINNPNSAAWFFFMQLKPQKMRSRHYLLTFTELFLSTFKVIIHIQALQELCDRITVGIMLLLNDFDQFFKHIPAPLVDYCSSSQIAQQMVGICLNCIEIPALSDHQ